jgi:hypothetical protein
MASMKWPEDGKGKFAEFFGPGQVDHQIRQAIQMCWMMLPEDKRGPEEVEKQMRRILDRAIRDLREDSEAFRKS